MFKNSREKSRYRVIDAKPSGIKNSTALSGSSHVPVVIGNWKIV